MTKHVDPQEALRLINEGALLIDVREPDEHARERIPNARLVPLSRLSIPLDRHEAEQVIFHCRSGARTATASERLAAAAGGDAYILRGGLDAWKAAGLPVLRDRRRPIEMMRQVQIAAGSLVVLGVGLGALLHPAFYALSGFVGAGLVSAGTTGICGMARILALAPWNRMAQA
ncbi:MAG TPA: rhodanese family protein [Terriglobales bacterium]